MDVKPARPRVKTPWCLVAVTKGGAIVDHRARFSTLNARYEDFLFAPVCEDTNGTRLSVLSALARMNVDPWDEATRLAAMPKAIAEKTLLSILDLVSGKSWKSPEAAAIAARLVRLLPQSGEAAAMAATGTANAASGMAKVLRSAQKLLVGVAVLCAGHVVHDAAPSATDGERTRHDIAIRRNGSRRPQRPDPNTIPLSR